MNSLLISKIEKFVGSRYSKSEYPVLEWQFNDWNAQKPLKGLRVLDATPLFCNTLLKHRSLLAAGAELIIGLSDFISYDKKVLDFVKNELALDVVDSPNGAYDVVADCAAAYCDATSAMGYVELTCSGVEKYEAKGARVYVADSSLIKRIETEIGTGDSFFRAMAQLGYNDWSGKTLVIFGGGKVGRGILAQSVARGVESVVVTDLTTVIDSVKANAAKIIDFKDRAAVDAAVCGADFVVMATGVEGAFERTVSVEAVMPSGAIFANMGAQDEFGDSVDNGKVLCGKRTINFILDEPTQMCYIDATMALHNYGAHFLATDKTASGLILPSTQIEAQMIEISRRHGQIASQITLF